MALTRREILIGSGMTLCIPSWVFSQSIDNSLLEQADTIIPVIPDFLKNSSNKDSLNWGNFTNKEAQGTIKPNSDEELLAAKISKELPPGLNPIEVALYFWGVGQGAKGEALKPYVTAWPVRWNPLIVEFFVSTSLKPSNDETAWCAAFMNYCLLRSTDGKKTDGTGKGTKSAAAMSFAKWGTSTVAPKPGDIVVFENVMDKRKGHVGFFLADKGESVLVLGGNQFEGKPVRHTVNRKLLKKDGTTLKLHSYRTDDLLHA
jgi:uncharacterized protein (TIGR02594 family)